MTADTRPTAAVVFDLDGTLVDTMESVPRAYAATIHALGGPVVSPAEIVAAWHLGPTAVVLAHFLGRPVTPTDVDCYHRYADAAYATVRPFPGVVPMLDALFGDGMRLALYTSATRRSTTGMLAAADLARFFRVVVCGDEVVQPKPAAEGLLRACQWLSLRPIDTAYVGDAETDLACADAAGALGIHAAWGASCGPTGRHLTASSPADIPRLVVQGG